MGFWTRLDAMRALGLKAQKARASKPIYSPECRFDGPVTGDGSGKKLPPAWTGINVDKGGRNPPIKGDVQRPPPPPAMRPDHLTRFPPGQSGNPRGRRKGIGDDLMEARHIAAEMYRGLGMAGLVDDTEHGLRDDKPEMLALVSAIRRGRVLGRRKVKGVGSITVEDVPTGRSDLCCVKVGFKREKGKGAAE